MFKEKEIEVLYLIHPIDEWVVQTLTEYDGKKLVNVTKGDLDLDNLNKEEKKSQEKKNAKFEKLIEFIKKSFDSKIKDVRTTTRLKNSPCCLVADTTDMGANMERILKMTNQQVTESKRILELNPDHTVVKNILKQFNNEGKKSEIKDWCSILLTKLF